ncbi:MAG: hypothetical protein ACD_4C00439G0002 [uncultured bacterium (gcode 4)]|uniref:Uncharacterized protein n=1 Tax=uncultured bacterium (gcode 4) TaxID=1234023 RepID=K2GS24_9BACT|nr:MAG: hypothetical protein ACD_4C00439G0002 [uncultured bacterium (gcode 4)]
MDKQKINTNTHFVLFIGVLTIMFSYIWNNASASRLKTSIFESKEISVLTKNYTINIDWKEYILNISPKY